MSNNTTSGFQVIKANVTPSTSASGGVPGAVGGTHFKWYGTFVCNGATPVTVTEPNITAKSSICISLKTVGGTVGAVPAIQTITVGTGFTVAGTALDTSTYAYTVENFA